MVVTSGRVSQRRITLALVACAVLFNLLSPSSAASVSDTSQGRARNRRVARTALRRPTTTGLESDPLLSDNSAVAGARKTAAERLPARPARTAKSGPVAGAQKAGPGDSSYKCLVDDGLPEHRICLLHNVMLWNGEILYISSSGEAEVPEVTTSWLEDERINHHLRVVRPSDLPFAWPAANMEVVEQAMLTQFIHWFNYYHIFAETAPQWHGVMCAYLGLCTYNASSDFRIFVFENRGPDPTTYSYRGLQGTQDLLRCLAPRHPVLHGKDEGVTKQPILLKTAVAGIGPECRAFHQWRPRHYQFWDQQTWSEEMAASWKLRISQCLGLDIVHNKVEQHAPKVMIIDRHYEASRHMLNIASIQGAVAALLPGVAVEVVYTEGMSFAQQAALYAQVSLLIWPHGASMANLIFLPQGAAAIEILPWPSDTHPLEWAKDIVRSFHLDVQLHHAIQDKASNVETKLSVLVNDPDYINLNDAEKVAMRERFECPDRQHAKCIQNWIHLHSNFVMGWEQLRPAVVQAYGALRSRLPNLPAVS